MSKLFALLVCLCALHESCSCQTHEIRLADGTEIKCRLIEIGKEHVVYSYNEDSATHIDTTSFADLVAITFLQHSNGNKEEFYENMFGAECDFMLTEATQKYMPSKKRIAGAVYGNRGKTISFAGAGCLGAGALILPIGIGVMTSNKAAYNEIVYDTGLAFMSLGSALITTGIVTWPIGAARLKKGKFYKREAHKYTPELSLNPALINTPGFSLTSAYGAGLTLTF